MYQSLSSRAHGAWLGIMPGLFVVLWSTGFIGGKLGLPYAPPLTFLGLRFVIVAALLAGLSAATRAPWPKSWAEAGHIAVAGLLVQGVYLGGVFTSLAHGVQAGVSSLIVGIQPLLVAAVAGPFLGERVTRWQWIGLCLGLAGVALVVSDKLGQGLGTPLGMGLSVLALIGMTLGTVYQKRFCQHMDLRTGNVIQFAVTAVALLLLASQLETMRIHWTGQFIFAFTWLCLVLSLGAITLLYILIRRGAAAQVSSLFFLVPPVTAIMAYALFDETLSLPALVGMAVTVAGVAMVNRRR